MTSRADCDLRALRGPREDHIRCAKSARCVAVRTGPESRTTRLDYFRELSDDAIQTILLRGTRDGRGAHLPAVALQAYGGAIADVPDADTAFSHRDTLFEFVAAARWSDPAEDQLRIAAVRRCATPLDRFASGAYVNTLGDEGSAGLRRAYPPDKLARLTALKDIHDPGNVFHLNQNIRPRNAGRASCDPR